MKEGQASKEEQVDESVLRKYDVLRKIGKGAYGVVYKARCKKNRKIVAVKKIFGAFQNSTDAQRTFREIMFLHQLNGHDNIITLMDVIRAKNDNDIYLVFDYMETDLHEVIKADLLEEIHKRYIIYQLLRALKYIHSGMLLHRDIKPSNILLNSECHIKVGDFGLARSISTDLSENKIPVLTDYVATRWYRAPEILLGSTNYTEGVDMWSLGCIMGELLLGRPLFRGNSTMNQLEKIIQVIGKPTKKDMDDIKSPFTDTIISSFVNIKRKNFSEIFAKASVEAVDLLKRLLQFNPTKRISAEDALRHKYVEQFHSIIDEPVCKRIITIPVDDGTKYRVSFYRNIVYYDIMRRKGCRPGGGQKGVERAVERAVQQAGQQAVQQAGQQTGQQAGQQTGQQAGQQTVHQSVDDAPSGEVADTPLSRCASKGKAQSTAARITPHEGKCAPKIRSTQSIHQGGSGGSGGRGESGRRGERGRRGESGRRGIHDAETSRDNKSAKCQPKRSSKREGPQERHNGKECGHPNEKHYYEVASEGKEVRSAQVESRGSRTKAFNGDAAGKLHKGASERGKAVASAASVGVTRRNDDKGGTTGGRKVHGKTASVVRGEHMVRSVDGRADSRAVRRADSRADIRADKLVRSHLVSAADVEAAKPGPPRVQPAAPQKEEAAKWRKRGGGKAGAAGVAARRVDFCGAHCHGITGRKSAPKKCSKKVPSKKRPPRTHNI
ncbi:mitogen-activated protein kinase 1, putative [Plasmodium vivax]|uniref:Mitogen-activated protein kinase n=1 Tax=Plasmodium vivax TaxID=5855 RepID=A0A1G4HIG2_PLAVI|nr:mitogen-activated protein kinase 1, putative [Plasmodium vivax]